MPYTKNPIVYPSGFVSVDVAKVNENFSILADAFVNDDPTTGIVKNADTVDGFHASHTPAPNTIVPLNANGILDLSASYVRSNVYTFRRVDLTEATSDYELQVGEEAIIRYNNERIIPLHISTRNGTVYEMIVLYSTNPTYFYPNNISYPNQFRSYRLYNYLHHGNWVIASEGYIGLAESGFRLFGGVNRALIFNETVHRSIVLHYADVTAYHHGISVAFWGNTTTPWTSLGTIEFILSNSGYILVRRLL